LIIVLEVPGTAGIVHPHLLFEHSRCLRFQIGAISVFFEIGGAAVHVDSHDLVRVELIPDIQNV
jgi:hypothetical protein